MQKKPQQSEERFPLSVILVLLICAAGIAVLVLVLMAEG